MKLKPLERQYRQENWKQPANWPKNRRPKFVKASGFL